MGEPGLSGRRRNYTGVRLSCLGEGKRRASVSLCLRRRVVTRRSPYAIELSAVDRAALQQRARAYTAPHYQVVRAKIVLLAADGLENTVIADRLDVAVQLVSKWRKRFHQEGLARCCSAARSTADNSITYGERRVTTRLRRHNETEARRFPSPRHDNLTPV